MNYEYTEGNNQYYASNLRQDGQKLNWDSAPGQTTLVVQTRYGEKAGNHMEEICRLLSEQNAALSACSQNYVDVLDGVRICFVDAASKAKNRGCALNGELRTYTVFPVAKEGNTVRIFAPRKNAVVRNYRDIPMKIRLNIHPCMEVKGLFRKKEEPTGYYAVSFPNLEKKQLDDYIDGTLRYRIGNLSVPVTREMLEKNTFYIKSEEKPEFSSQNRGLVLE